ncbi:MAG: choice-of-anchor L domain-containing protein [Methanobacteriota archaeon]
MKRVFLIVLGIVIGVSFAPSGAAQPPPPAQCSDGFDNDGDNLTDYPADPGCTDANDPDEWNSPPPPPVQCGDGFDNDGDTFTDYPADPGCTDSNDPDEWNPPPAQCSDGFDNDGDNLTDYPADPGCTNATDPDEWDPPPPPPAQCSDGFDNDADNLTDYPADPGCTDANDPDEWNAPPGECNDGLDNDADNLTDYPADPDCTSEFDPSEASACPALPLALAMAAPASLVASADCITYPPLGVPNAVYSKPLADFPTSGPTYAVLTSGDAALADDPNDSGGSGANVGGPNFRGNTDYDVTVLRVNVTVPEGGNCLALDFRFLSDEYPEWVGTSFNDAFIAELDVSDWTTNGSAISAPHNFAFDENGDVISINSAGAATMTAANAAGTTYDGATALLRARTPVTAGTHAVYLSIFDQGDHILDSAVFLDRLQVTAEPVCETGIAPVGLVVDVSMTQSDYWILEQAVANVDVSFTNGSVADGAAVNLTVRYYSGNETVDAVLGLTSCAAWNATGTTNASGRVTFPIPQGILTRCLALLGLADFPTDLLNGTYRVEATATKGIREGSDATTYGVSTLPPLPAPAPMQGPPTPAPSSPEGPRTRTRER